ncbi:MAG: hypothetical protein FOGNACKC_05021 [Anaerolineae bacterium]|nr:hypothetical protein [Anaerolineae bacterium]
MMKNYSTFLQPKRLNLLLFALGAAVVIGGLLLLSAPAQAAPPAQSPSQEPSVTGGQSLWSENCMPCHGATGQGDGPTAQSLPNPPANFTDPEKARNYVPAQNFDTIKNGRMDKMMPPWKNKLSDEQIWDAVAYVWRLGVPAEQLTAGEKIYTEQCAACHGDDGTGSGPQAGPDINDFTNLEQMVQLSQADLLANYSASGAHADLKKLSDDDIWASLEYVRGFSFALPARNGTLTGQVINAATGQPVANIPVALHAFQNGAPLESLTGQTDANGVYTFNKLLTDHTIFYVVEGKYQDVPYVTQEPGMFLPDSNEVKLNLTVYDTTTTGDAIDVTQLHYLLSFNPGVINVLQIFVVGNTGDKTFIGQDGKTFGFAIPKDATNVRFQNDTGQRFSQDGSTYFDSEPVMPGEEGLTIAAIYDVPFSGDQKTIEFPLTENVKALDVLMTDQGATLTSNQVDFVENKQFQGNTFAVFTRKDVPKGQVVSLNLSGLNDLTFAAPPDAPPGSAPASADTSWFNQELAKWVVLGLGLVAVVVAAVVYPMRRPAMAAPSSDSPETRRQKLLLTLARLDEVYENGDLDEDVYQRARAKYKAELADLLEMAG